MISKLDWALGLEIHEDGSRSRAVSILRIAMATPGHTSPIMEHKAVCVMRLRIVMAKPPGPKNKKPYGLPISHLRAIDFLCGITKNDRGQPG